MRIYQLTPMLLFISHRVLALGEPDSTLVSFEGGGTEFNFGWMVFKALGSLIIIFFLIVGLVYLLKKYWGKQLGGGIRQENFQILARLPLHPKQSLALVRVFDRILLIGITENNITLLSEYNNPQDIQKIINEMSTTPFSTSTDRFLKVIRKEMEKS
ncbi:MAG: flagellar biosynthetic protein FliO [Calditrichaeota bacterium]|nr:MAG: flagellar biosynthetic protein FliO [Calditrichota bacterium]